MTTSNFDEYARTQIDELKLLGSETHTSVIFKLDSASFNEEAKEHIIIGRIFPHSDIFKEGAFQIQIKVPPYYPLNTPKVKFITPIYHPSVNNDGEFHHELLLKTACWTSKTTLKDIVKAIVERIDAAEVYCFKNCGLKLLKTQKFIHHIHIVIFVHINKTIIQVLTVNNMNKIMLIL
ncbi:unnamed protein product [Rotaria socialis]